MENQSIRKDEQGIVRKSLNIIFLQSEKRALSVLLNNDSFDQNNLYFAANANDNIFLG